jgi:hypothetical protein
MCDSLEQRLASIVEPDVGALLERLRLLRHAFATWPDSPPSPSVRNAHWLELLALEENVASLVDAERATARNRFVVPAARPRVA